MDNHCVREYDKNLKFKQFMNRNTIRRYSTRVSIESVVNPLTNNKIVDWSKLKAFADDKFNAIKKLKFVLLWIVGWLVGCIGV